MLSIPWPSPDSNLELLQVTFTNDSFLIVVKSSHTSAFCPVCLKPSSRKHSQYSRKVQDLPICNKAVELIILTRRWFCDQPDCTVKVFTERYDWISPKGRRTKRTDELLRKIAFSTSCLSAEKVAKSAHIPVSHDTLLNLVRHTHIEPKVSPFCRH
ncbi:transposase family protein [Schinkia azotoformans]|uniref:transposase family protein n=1 Tax=Schinkia azotoformans TaxID=1454 RepID=UPI002DB9E498|nr:transposase family protein [Schinkia azotoformans]MEC1723076.1 transposase family protein [Schinkia azotoformans]MED4414730.1 transposase family protein [Schinkia azotoformans]